MSNICSRFKSISIPNFGDLNQFHECCGLRITTFLGLLRVLRHDIIMVDSGLLMHGQQRILLILRDCTYMSTKILDSKPKITTQRTQINNGVHNVTTIAATSSLNGTHDFLADLPTFPLEAGWRTVYDTATQRYHQQPLTLLDILYPNEDDVGVVYMAQSPLHNLLTDLLSVMLSTYLGARDWLILHDVLVLWGIRGIPPKSPDLAAIPGGRLPIDEKSYRVGRDGPLPAFVIEVTSQETRNEDLDNKPLHYAAMGIKEFLIIDILNETTEAWDLIGYRLEDGPYYRRLSPDAEKGITFTTVGLRFVAVNRTRIEVYDSATGQRLLTSDELKARAEAEEIARKAADDRAAALERRVRELESQLGIQPTTPTTD